jgi:hypothetical protein
MSLNQDFEKNRERKTMTPAKINDLIVSCLSPDLLKPAYRAQYKRLRNYDPTHNNDDRVRGHCYIASEAAYYLYARNLGFRPYQLNYSPWSHWFLGRKPSQLHKRPYDSKYVARYTYQGKFLSMSLRNVIEGIDILLDDDYDRTHRRCY